MPSSVFAYARCRGYGLRRADLAQDHAILRDGKTITSTRGEILFGYRDIGLSERFLYRFCSKRLKRTSKALFDFRDTFSLNQRDLGDRSTFGHPSKARFFDG